jgi:hypothetical protein
MGGKSYPFVPLPGAFMAASADRHGSMIEVYPERAGLTFPEHDGPAEHTENETVPRFWPFHLLLSVPLAQDEIERIGAREGWRTKLFGRGRPGQKRRAHGRGGARRLSCCHREAEASGRYRPERLPPVLGPSAQR